MLHIQGVSKQFGAKILFENADAHLGHRSRVALIGPNGSGKSTLLRILMGQESADSGTVTRATHLSIGHLAQEVPKFGGRTVLEEAMRLDGRREEILATKLELEKRLATHTADAESPTGADDLERYGRILEELEHLDEYRLEAKAKEVLSGMGFPAKDWDRPLGQFSGGWLMRVALSRILILDPDLMILDEPTNHLDLESLLWLEQFLRAFRGALLLVSHDTEFLNRMVDEVLEIDQRKLWSYRGNLDSYARQKEERLTILRSQYAGQQAKIAEIEAFVRRFGAKATKARQAQSRLKQLEKMERIELDEDRQTVRFRFPPAPHSGKEVVTVRRAQVSFGDKTVFRDLDWVISRGSRVAVVGVNGAGKTTLLRLLAGALSPTRGEARHGHEVRVGYYAQLQAESLNMSNTILKELELVAPEMQMARIRGVAGAFLFSGDAVEKRCAVLSGGEKARVALAKLLLSPSNFLILDEPTNHLDIESRGVLLEALQDYEGTLCIVSHDRAFISPLVDSVLEIIPSPDSSGSRVVQLLGSYDEYLARKQREISEAGVKLSGTPGAATRTNAVSETPAAAKRTGPSNNQRRAWEKEREQIEGEITRLESRQSELHGILGDTATYTDKERSLLLVEEQRGIGSALNEKLRRWEELCGWLEG